MKTPLQELLKLESDLTHMFDSDQRVAMALLEHIRTNRNEMLEKEKQQIIDAYEVSHISMMTAEQYYYETFNTNEK